jgi:hypothetical protein
MILNLIRMPGEFRVEDMLSRSFSENEHKKLADEKRLYLKKVSPTLPHEKALQPTCTLARAAFQMFCCQPTFFLSHRFPYLLLSSHVLRRENKLLKILKTLFVKLIRQELLLLLLNTIEHPTKKKQSKTKCNSSFLNPILLLNGL